MPIELADYERKARRAVQVFWKNRQAARQKQVESGKGDQGERASVTAGKNMDGFIALILDVVHANGLVQAEVYRQRTLLTLPGYFRPTKSWDLLVLHRKELIAAVELKSQVGPSFGNNFNNRAEEAIGTAHDLWTAYREGAFGSQPPPFAGWLMLVEDAPSSRISVKAPSPHFPVFGEFKDSSYLERYDLLCQKLTREKLYTAASVLASPRQSIKEGNYSEISPLTGLKTFITALAGHIAAEAARLG